MGECGHQCAVLVSGGYGGGRVRARGGRGGDAGVWECGHQRAFLGGGGWRRVGEAVPTGLHGFIEDGGALMLELVLLYGGAMGERGH